MSGTPALTRGLAWMTAAVLATPAWAGGLVSAGWDSRGHGIVHVDGHLHRGRVNLFGLVDSEPGLDRWFSEAEVSVAVAGRLGLVVQGQASEPGEPLLRAGLAVSVVHRPEAWVSLQALVASDADTGQLRAVWSWWPHERAEVSGFADADLRGSSWTWVADLHVWRPIGIRGWGLAAEIRHDGYRGSTGLVLGAGWRR